MVYSVQNFTLFVLKLNLTQHLHELLQPSIPSFYDLHNFNMNLFVTSSHYYCYCLSCSTQYMQQLSKCFGSTVPTLQSLYHLLLIELKYVYISTLSVSLKRLFYPKNAQKELSFCDKVTGLLVLFSTQLLHKDGTSVSVILRFILSF